MLRHFMYSLGLLLVVACCNNHYRHAPQASSPKMVPTSEGPTASQTPPSPSQQTASPARKAPTTISASKQTELNQQIKQQFGEHCRFERACDQLIGVDCNAATDGPYYYVQAGSLEIVARCGGYCRGRPCEDCPPPTWQCTTY